MKIRFFLEKFKVILYKIFLKIRFFKKVFFLLFFFNDVDKQNLKSFSLITRQSSIILFMLISIKHK